MPTFHYLIIFVFSSYNDIIRFIFMYDAGLAKEILEQIHHSIEVILKRFSRIKAVNDFTDTQEVMDN